MIFLIFSLELQPHQNVPLVNRMKDDAVWTFSLNSSGGNLSEAVFFFFFGYR